MKCPQCQHENPASLKFCGECGARLASICSACGASNAPAQKFCGECGAALTQGAPAAKFASPESYTPKHLAEKILTSKSALEGERKQVTVLFADLKGSMELLVDRDPEEARKLLDPVLERMIEAVHRYEGTVNQVMGDGIMALFGAPLAHEDHAVRACYAALRMQEAVKRYGEEVRRTAGVPVSIRVGVNSGEVVVRSIGSDLHMDYTAVGQTAHLAGRMEQAALPGSILLTADTLRLAEGYVEVTPLGPVPVKGLTEPVEGLRVPATVQAVLAARIDRLPAEEKHLLQTAAVIGKDVPFALLQAVTDANEEGLRRSLTQLQAAEFLYEASLYPELEFTFKHALTHEVAYTSLLQERRTAIHGRVVEGIERLYEGRLTEQVERLAQHAWRGGLWAKAAVYFREAGAKAAGRSAHREAVDCLDQALAALGHLSETRETTEQAIDLRLELRNSLWPLGEIERMAQRLGEAEALAETLDDQLRLGRVLAQRTQQFYLTGQNDRAVESGRRALAIAQALENLPLEVGANFYLGVAHYLRGEYLAAMNFCRQNLERLRGELARERFGLPGVASVLSRYFLAVSLAEQGEFAEGISYGEEAIQLAEAADDPFSVGLAHFYSGLLSLRQGDLRRAVRLLERCLELCRLTNIMFLLPPTASALGCAYALLRRNADAGPLLEEAQERAARMSGVLFRPLVHVWVGEGHLHAGLLDEALESATRALTIAREYRERGHEGWALRLLGEVVSHRDRPYAEKAEGYYREALALADDLGMRPLLAHCHLGLGKLYRRAGKRQEAQERLTTAAALYREMDMRFWLEQAEAELRETG